MTREYVSFTTGSVVHVRDSPDGVTLCGRACEGFDNEMDALLWQRSPANRCATCEKRASASTHPEVRDA